MFFSPPGQSIFKPKKWNLRLRTKRLVSCKKEPITWPASTKSWRFRVQQYCSNLNRENIDFEKWLWINLGNNYKTQSCENRAIIGWTWSHDLNPKQDTFWWNASQKNDALVQGLGLRRAFFDWWTLTLIIWIMAQVKITLRMVLRFH